MSSDTVPYIVCTAHPDYKRPYVSVIQKQTTCETLIVDLTEAYFKALVDELYYSEEYHGELSLTDSNQCISPQSSHSSADYPQI